jgi:hypothetical protein
MWVQNLLDSQQENTGSSVMALSRSASPLSIFAR